MSLYSLRVLFFGLLGLALLSSPLQAQQNKNKNKRPLVKYWESEYEPVVGLAKVISVDKVVDAGQSFFGMDEYAITFSFEAKEGQLIASLREQEEFTFFLRSDTIELNVGAEYLKAYQIRPGTRYAFTILQCRKGKCPKKYIYGDLGGMPNDLFEVRGEKLDGYKAHLLAKALADAEANLPQTEPEPEPEPELSATTEPKEPELSPEEKRRIEREKADAERKRKEEELAKIFEEEERKRSREPLPEPGKKTEPVKQPEPTTVPEPIKVPEVTTPTDPSDPDFDREKLRAEMEAKLRAEMEAKMRAEMLEQERLEAERQAKLERERLEAEQRQQQALAKQQEKESKRLKKEEEKRRKEEERLAKEQAKLEEKQRQEEELLRQREEMERQRQIEAEKERIKRELEDEIRTKLQKEAEERAAAEAARKAEAEREAARQKRLEEEIKRGDCVYQNKLSGVIKILTVDKIKEAEDSHLNYAEYRVTYKFTPDNLDDIPKKDRKIWEQEHTFLLDPMGKSANPSSTYVKKYSVFPNTQYKGFAQVLEKGICSELIIFSAQLPIDPNQVR